MSGDTTKKGGTKLTENDSMVGGRQQASPAAMSLNGREEEQEKETKPKAVPVVEAQNNVSDAGEEQCRICHSPGTEECPTFHPCKCKGSIEFVHEDCLLRWLNDRSTTQCEICKHVIKLRYEYAENTPSRLPLVEVIREIAKKAARWRRSLTWGDLILSLVAVIMGLIFLSVLLIAIIIMSGLLCRLIFFESVSELIDSGSDPDMLVRDCFNGLSLLGKMVSALVIVLLSKYGSDMVFERLRELWLQKVRRRRQQVMELLYPRPGHLGFGVLNLVLKQLYTPVFTWLLIALRVWVLLAFSVWMFPSLSYSLVESPVVDPAYGWLGFLGVVALCYLGKRSMQWFSEIHDSIRDDKYLMGKRVQNLETRMTNHSDT